MDISTLIVGSIVILAAVYMIRHFRDIVRGKSGCSCGTSSCSACQAKHVSGNADTTTALPPCCRDKN
ncbi:FeoB-associated Cys-rich membrane protein [Megasphaera paucivorans]|uniref:Virus attachment protein p12 family protein n=1 Tax=Megasphaera paucivorans TaxID=349095 RepID=A0A1G9VID2_9FIRM|nr:FeoB-associated Cys-rich membrane protein [Megasphaera paucivorans]SDM71876.1 Virus attachment protein p12 family protein [Megasphaera paucivorans]